MKKLNLIILFALIQTVCQGQTDLLNSQYLFDKTFATPANFSQQEKFKAFTNYQYSSGRERAGSEYLYSLAANYKANEKNSVGINIVNGRFGQEATFLGYVNYTYNLKMSENAYLSNGFGFGFQQYRLNLNDALGVNQTDPVFKGSIYSSKFDFRIGSTAVVNKKLFFGVAFDNVLSRYNNQSENEVNYLPTSFRRINMTFMAGNSHELQSDLDVNYEAMYSYNFGGLSILDVNAGVRIAKLIGAGLSYRRFIRSEEGEVLSSGIIRPYLVFDLDKTKNNFRLSYAYGFSPNKVNTVGLSTHDIGIQYVLK